MTVAAAATGACGCGWRRAGASGQIGQIGQVSHHRSGLLVRLGGADAFDPGFELLEGDVAGRSVSGEARVEPLALGVAELQPAP